MMNYEIFQLRKEGKIKKLPAWIRTVIKLDSGKFLIPAAYAGNEQIIFLAASFDGALQTMYKNHIFIDIDWIINEYKNANDAQELKTILTRRIK